MNTRMVVPKAATTNDYEVIAQDPLKHYFTSIEKKVRNLEKRKVKLDAYKKKVQDGLTLDPDQKAAADKYDAVLGSLEFAKDLLKSLEVTMSEVSKIQRKNIKRETMVQEDKESWRIAFIMKATRVLDVIYNNKMIQEDFLNGTNGACILTAGELKLLVEFYEVFVVPSYESGTNVIEDSVSAANHLYELVEARTKSIMGTTYKELHALIDRICSLDYFEDLQIPDAVLQQETEQIKDEENESSSSLDAEEDVKEEDEAEEDNEDEKDNATEDVAAVPESPEVSDTISSPTDLTEEPAFLESKNFEASSLRSSSNQNTQDWANAPEPTEPFVADNIGQKMTFHYSENELPASEPAAPSIQDVLAEVQGHCQFLQDSMIDTPSLSFMTQQQPQSMSSRGLEPVAFHSEANSNLTNNTLTNNSSAPPNNQSYSSNSSPMIVQNTESTNPTLGLSHETLHGSQQHSRPSSISPKVQNNYMESSANYIQQNDSDNLGMGQTTFGSQQEHSQYPSENTNSYAREGKNFSPFENATPATQEEQYEQQPNILSEIAPDPPTAHIPLPNEQQSGYQSYHTTAADANDLTKQEYNMQKPYNETNAPNEADLQNYEMGDSQQHDMQHNDDMAQSNYDSANMDDGNYPNNRQGGTRNVNTRSRGYNNASQGGYRNNSGGQVNSGGGYRNNYRQRGFSGNYDSMGRPNNYHNNNYHGGGGQGGGNYNNYRGNQDNMYMYRRGGNSNGPRNNRGGGFGGQRGGNNRMSGSGYSRSRTFNRPQHQNEQHVN